MEHTQETLDTLNLLDEYFATQDDKTRTPTRPVQEGDKVTLMVGANKTLRGPYLSLIEFVQRHNIGHEVKSPKIKGVERPTALVFQRKDVGALLDALKALGVAVKIVRKDGKTHGMVTL